MACVCEQNSAPSKNSDNTVRRRTPCLETFVVLGANEGLSVTTRPETHFIELVQSGVLATSYNT